MELKLYVTEGEDIRLNAQKQLKCRDCGFDLRPIPEKGPWPTKCRNGHWGPFVQTKRIKKPAMVMHFWSEIQEYLEKSALDEPVEIEPHIFEANNWHMSNRSGGFIWDSNSPRSVWHVTTSQVPYRRNLKKQKDGMAVLSADGDVGYFQFLAIRQ